MGYIAMIIVLGIMFYVLIYEFIIPSLKLKKSNKEWIENNGNKKKKLCLKCKYSVKKKDYAFSTGELRNALVQEIPVYCKRFKKQLNYKYDCRCIANDNSIAFYEDDKNN